MAIENKNSHITFFIPAFNCEKTISESIHSIIDTNLTEGDELIITDDYSTDGTAQILADFAKKYPYITILTHSRNKGGATARNTSIEHAKNELLFCLDSDNILAPHSIAPLKKYMVDTGSDAVAFEWTYFFEHTTDVLHKKVQLIHGPVTVQDCLDGKSTPPPSGNYLFTKDSWLKAGGYPDGNWLDTWGFGIRQLFAGAKMYTLPDTFYYHRRGHESYWVREVKKNPPSLTALQILIPYFKHLSPRSIDYILGSGRYTWFENLHKKHVRLQKKSVDIAQRIEPLKKMLQKTFPTLYTYYLSLRWKK